MRPTAVAFVVVNTIKRTDAVSTEKENVPRIEFFRDGGSHGKAIAENDSRVALTCTLDGLV